MTRTDSDKAFVDRAEELGVKDLIAAFVTSLATTTTQPPHIRNCCTCGAANAVAAVTPTSSPLSRLAALDLRIDGAEDDGPRQMPEVPHDATCAWARLIALFGNEMTARMQQNVRAQYRKWARRVNRTPDEEPYKNVVAARKFLESDKEES